MQHRNRTHTRCGYDIRIPSTAGYLEVVDTVLLLGWLAKDMSVARIRVRSWADKGEMLPIFRCAHKARHVPFDFDFGALSSRQGFRITLGVAGKSRAGLMMDNINLSDPSPRITATTSKNLSAKRAQLRIQAFLDDFENRNSSLNGGDKAVTVQLHKLNQALLEERQKQKVAGEGQ